MHLVKTNILGNPNVGMYGYTTDEYCLIGQQIPKRQSLSIEAALGVPVYQARICGNELLGVFLAGVQKKLLVPGIAFDAEIGHLGKLGIDVVKVETDLTALGNNMAISENGCVVNPEYGEDTIALLKRELGISVIRGTIGGYNIVGSLCKMNSKGALVSVEANDAEAKLLASQLGVPLSRGTVNQNSQYISSGIICNSKGFVIGDLSTGPEIMDADTALGFLGADDE
ncbi:MAG: translation initiation factor IF-6 [archaeon]